MFSPLFLLFKLAWNFLLILLAVIKVPIFIPQILACKKRFSDTGHTIFHSIVRILFLFLFITVHKSLIFSFLMCLLCLHIVLYCYDSFIMFVCCCFYPWRSARSGFDLKIFNFVHHYSSCSSTLGFPTQFPRI